MEESCCTVTTGPGYATPKDAQFGPREKIIYITSVYTGTNTKRPDYLATVDVDIDSKTYGQIIHRLPVGKVDDELHHSGWNACSSCHQNESFQRRYLVLPSLVSGRRVVYISSTLSRIH